MKVEYMKARLGEGHELHISSEEYKRVNSEAGWDEHPSLVFAVQSYVRQNECISDIRMRDVEEAYRHIKKRGTILLTTKSDGDDRWCEIYTVTDGEIIPIRTGIEGTINLSSKTRQQMKKQ